MSSIFPYWYKKFRILPEDTSGYVSMKEYCRVVGLSVNGARYRIFRSKVKAYKMGGRWWLKLPED